MKIFTGHVYKDRGGKCRWRIKSPNGRIVAVSGESFHSGYNARRALKRFVLEMSMIGVRVMAARGAKA
jgi:uncharacterized protein YegP (UPF0339 family)